jgi:hypothetical protein
LKDLSVAGPREWRLSNPDYFCAVMARFCSSDGAVALGNLDNCNYPRIDVDFGNTKFIVPLRRIVLSLRQIFALLGSKLINLSALTIRY